jgi:hypothetical protein
MVEQIHQNLPDCLREIDMESVHVFSRTYQLIHHGGVQMLVVNICMLGPGIQWEELGAITKRWDSPSVVLRTDRIPTIEQALLVRFILLYPTNCHNRLKQ